MRSALVPSCGLIFLVIALTGCDARDPYRRTDVWHPTGASAGNLAAQVANPRDLVQGRSAGPSDAHAPSLAIERVWSGQPRALPPIGTYSPGGGGSSGSGS